MENNDMLDFITKKLLTGAEKEFTYELRGIKYTVKYLMPDTKKSINIPSILAIPQGDNIGKKLAVESNSLETNNETKLFAQAMQTVRNLATKTTISPCPILVPILPSEKDAPYFQQLSRECFDIPEDDFYYRIDEQVAKIIEKSKSIVEEERGIILDDKIFLNGYSSSGVFAQRFSLLHPELIDIACIGGASGSIPLPNDELGYPLGVADYRKITGKSFDLESYKKIAFRYYVGELETLGKTEERLDDNGKPAAMHDMSYFDRSIPTEVGKKQRKLLGADYFERLKETLKILKESGVNIEHTIIPKRSHDNKAGEGVNEFGDKFISREYIKILYANLVYKLADLAHMHDKKVCDSLINRFSSMSVNDSIDAILISLNKLVKNGKLKEEDALDNAGLIIALNPQKYPKTKDLLDRLIWLRRMNLDNQEIPLGENHRLVMETFDKFNELIGTKFDAFYTGGLMGYIATDQKLERYHGDLDLMINESQLQELYELVKASKDFEFVSNMDHKEKNGHEYKIVHKGKKMSIGLFLFERLPDGRIIQNEYYYRTPADKKDLVVDKHYFTKKYADMVFEGKARSHNGKEFKMLSLESIYNTKKVSRPKDKFDADMIRDFVNLDIDRELDEEKRKEYIEEGLPAGNSIVSRMEEIMEKNARKEAGVVFE